MNQEKRETTDVLVIGGGASGMVAAIEAARYGARVVLLEKENRVGKKLLATGNGRCNFLNLHASLTDFHGENNTIIESVLNKMTVGEVKEYFQMLGITPKVEEAGKVYPYSEQGSNILDLLRYEMERQGVVVHTGEKAAGLLRKPEGWRVQTVEGNAFEAQRMILATGGKAGSQFGADDSGYALARSQGHGVTALQPALVQLKLAAPWLKTLKGIKWQGAASVEVKGKALRTEAGELLFTDYGISGPPVLQLSRTVHDQPDQPHQLNIHLLPAWSEKAIQEELILRFNLDPDKPAELCLLGLFHKRLISVLLKETGIHNVTQPAHQVSVKDLNRLATLCTDWKVPITGTLGWNQAQVTAGGVHTHEIDPVTMESRLRPGFYLTGEIMDVDGDCGGFNLYWAWATGIIAGRHAASKGVSR